VTIGQQKVEKGRKRVRWGENRGWWRWKGGREWRWEGDGGGVDRNWG